VTQTDGSERQAEQKRNQFEWMQQLAAAASAFARNPRYRADRATVREFAAAQSQAEKNWKKATNEDAVWPNVPYHHGMGRIKAYDDWLASQDDDRERRIAETLRQMKTREAQYRQRRGRDRGYER
jgi:hypothetical protein